MNLFEHIKSVLAQNEKYCKDGKLFKNVIVEDALKVEEELLSILLNDDKAKKHFFTEVGKVFVFDKIKFQKFVSNKQFLPDSYTSFKNKIGLTANGEYLTEAKEVVLSWAYKDCVLEGGQSKDEQKLNEVFWNKTLAPDEIDRLLEPKAFTNFKKYDEKGVSKVDDISLDDNLIIKGNNLLALHSLKKVYKEKIKLIFIDPPYNTESDSFRYNDSFNHSTWLTFMKNRLEVAKELLSNDGLIWISLSDKEAHYLKVLGDEIFDQDNFVSDIIWNSTKSVTNTAIISDAHTHILLYAKSKETLKKNRTSFRLTADETKFSNPDNDPRGKWVADPFQVGGERPNQLFEITNPNTGKIYKPNPGSSWKNEKKVFDELLKDNRIVFGVSGDAGPQRKRFWSEAKERGEVTTTLWNKLPTTTNGTQHLKKIFKSKVFENPKPEGLLERIIQLSTSVNDIVLDFFVGSGTTITAAHKMNRRYIGIEQMDYINEVTVPRVVSVIEGEQGGISVNHNWSGGGSFVYFELMKNNSSVIDLINNSKTKEDLNKIWIALSKEYFISHKLNSHFFNSESSEFYTLSFEDMQMLLIDLLDKNYLYVNYSDVNDTSHNVSKEDILLTNRFYNNG